MTVVPVVLVPRNSVGSRRHQAVEWSVPGRGGRSRGAQLGARGAFLLVLTMGWTGCEVLEDERATTSDSTQELGATEWAPRGRFVMVPPSETRALPAEGALC